MASNLFKIKHALYMNIFHKGFSKGFKNNLEGVNVLFMQSDGGLTPMNS